MKWIEELLMVKASAEMEIMPEVYGGPPIVETGSPLKALIGLGIGVGTAAVLVGIVKLISLPFRRRKKK